MSIDDKDVNEQKFVSKVCEALDDSVNRIDAETNQRIIAARQQALAKAPRNRALPKLLTAVATAASILLAVIIVNTQFNQPIENENVEAIELLAEQENFELYEELDFYAWLAEEDVTS